ncbi:DUF4167 domain-containing protein [Pseudorhodobacter sp.]|uniref:DUF4167 domain-containing protein n=1 Tax=Pseudorhodobacter sp. TaxID=1934400 RepID=UPI002AFEDD7E|nr:DUF4167 domain-containing protein [Pseudorhodobacter sp.]
MRSSKSRSRSKSNRPRTLGNITNRVFDSSGPEGKVRGTPQQIIDKYILLARDAQLSNDRVNAENFLQHAEHYTRMLGEATREMQVEQDARRQQDSQNQQTQQREYQPRDRQQDRGESQQPDLRDDRPDTARDDRRDDNKRDDSRRDDNKRDDRRDEKREDTRRDDRRDRDATRPDTARSDSARSDAEGRAPEVIETASNTDDSGLVETPETRRPPRQRVARHKPAAAAPTQPELAAAPTESEKSDRSPRKPRGPRKPKAKSVADSPAEAAGNEAAE